MLSFYLLRALWIDGSLVFVAACRDSTFLFLPRRSPDPLAVPARGSNDVAKIDALERGVFVREHIRIDVSKGCLRFMLNTNEAK
ncbi:hypothetical protein AXG89_34030 [Burkholderia sp. PAMC 26561]|nr:hypothetical protein AXG89_34030 [Burkholderia sp. PAMC 26561]